MLKSPLKHALKLFASLFMDLLVLIINLSFYFSNVFSTLAAVTYIDSSAVQALKELYQEYKLRDIQVVFNSISLNTNHRRFFLN